MRRTTKNYGLNATFRALADLQGDEDEGIVPDLIVFSHLRWDFVFQRPQHLMTRFSRDRRVYFVEEPVFVDDAEANLDVLERESDVKVVVPRLPRALADDPAGRDAELAELIERFVHQTGIALDDYTAWYYTPMALAFTRDLSPTTVVYDCMDELSAFKDPPPGLVELENELLARADVVFTGGHALYEAKRDRHPNIHAMPSSIDRAHFARAERTMVEPADQAEIAKPRIGYCGVVDERFDVELLRGAAERRPGWQFVIVGPVVKIDPAILPRLPNIHYLGMKSYAELPTYLAGWDVAMLPFARNDATRFISPTKTPEYLAAGCPVVSTSIRDVVRPYGDRGLARIADDPAAFVAAIGSLMAMTEKERESWRGAVNRFLGLNSWGRTWARMSRLERECREAKRKPQTERGSALWKKSPVFDAARA